MSAFSASQRTELIKVRRATSIRDDYGTSVDTFADAFQAYVSVRHGTGEERRRAAQEGGSQAATFGFEFNGDSASISIKDQLQYAGADWDINSVAIEPRNAGVVVTAVRSV